MQTARNVAIIMAIAAGVAFIPGGHVTRDIVSGALSEILLTLIVVVVLRLWAERRLDIHALGDLHRFMLYGAGGLFVLAMASRRDWLDSNVGTIAFIVVLSAVVYALLAVWNRWRAYE